MQLSLLAASERHQKATQLLMAVSPSAVLQRGYAVVRRPDGSIVRDAATMHLWRKPEHFAAQRQNSRRAVRAILKKK